MLMHLSVKNLALIDQINLDFHEGLTILTGETGAGKSIIIDAVNLVLGERADRELIQTGKEYALVEAIFSVTDQQHIGAILREYGIAPEEDGTLLLMRELSTSGKNLCRINGRIVTLSVLKNISRYLVDIHGQHQHQSLLSIEQHRELLDMLGGSKIASTKEKVEGIYHNWQKVRKKIEKLSGIGMDGERRKDILSFQIDEIENANLKENEEEELSQERSMLINGEKIINIINSIYQDIYSGSNDYPSVSDLLGRCSAELGQIAHLEPALDALNRNIETLLYQLEDIVFEIRTYRDQFDHDPYRLDKVEKRLEIIRSLKRKYGADIHEIFAYLKDSKDELQTLENSQELLEKLKKEEEELFHQLFDVSHTLSLARRETANYFEQQLLGQLAELGMDKSSFQVNIDPTDNLADPSAIREKLTTNGYDIVEFMISTNLGEPVKPLWKIISGGEMSRIMLAFKTILAQVDNIPTLIFDEIDVGISGRIAHVVGEKMGRLSRSRQVICVTHLPQIAAMADNHYKIEKQYADQHTRTMVNRLDDRGRQEEIARMTGGKTLSKANLEHSQELIRMAQEFKNKLG